MTQPFNPDQVGGAEEASGRRVVRNVGVRIAHTRYRRPPALHESIAMVARDLVPAACALRDEFNNSRLSQSSPSRASEDREAWLPAGTRSEAQRAVSP